jgi:CubicO group peptidase (beta-lactamase class C family)
MTYGHLIGEVIRRITGQRLGEFFAAHIAGPLGADFHIGLPPSEFHRVANVVPPPAHPDDLTQLDPNSVEFKTKTGPAMKAEDRTGPSAGGAPTSARPTATAMLAR